MDKTQAGHVARELIAKIGNNDFFIDNKGPYRILSNDTIANNCKIALYESNEFAAAQDTLQRAVDKFGVRQSVFLELIKSLDDAEPNWFYSEVMSMWVPYEFFKLNRGSIHINVIHVY